MVYFVSKKILSWSRFFFYAGERGGLRTLLVPTYKIFEIKKFIKSK